MLLLNILLSSAIGVRKKKYIIVSKTLGIIRLNTNDNLNHIFSIIIDVLKDKIPNPDKIVDTYIMVLSSKNTFKINKPKTMVNIVKEGLDFIFIKIGCK